MFEDAFARGQADFQFFEIDGLGQKRVRAGVHAQDDVLALTFAGQQNNVHVLRRLRFAQPAAQVGAVHAWHHPVENGKVGGIGALENRLRFQSIRRADRLIAPLQQCLFHQDSRGGFVVGNQYFHGLLQCF